MARGASKAGSRSATEGWPIEVKMAMARRQSDYSVSHSIKNKLNFLSLMSLNELTQSLTPTRISASGPPLLIGSKIISNVTPALPNSGTFASQPRA